MNGRGSASADELTAAKYIASQLKLLRIKPAGDNGGYLQTVKFKRRVRGAPDAGSDRSHHYKRAGHYSRPRSLVSERDDSPFSPP